MTAHDPNELVERRLNEAVAFMRTQDKELCLLGTLAHHKPDSQPHDSLQNYEAAARNRGTYLAYVGAEVHTYDSDEPLYYVFLSTHPHLALDEVKPLLDDFRPIHQYEWTPEQAA